MYLAKSLKVFEIAALIDGEVVGDKNIEIVNINNIEDAAGDDLTFCGAKPYVRYLVDTTAKCIIINKNFRKDLDIEELPKGKTYILADNAYMRFTQLLNAIYQSRPGKSASVHGSAIIGNGTSIAESAFVGPNCVVGDNCVIEDNVILHANIVLYDSVKIGKNTELHANVVCAEGVIIGESCTIHPGAVIGSDGFGFTENPDGSYTKIPQLGNVIIGNKVEIGSNTTIDRAVVGSTVIEDGVILDNLVHIAHNVKVGRFSAMAAQTGVSGSTKVGKRNRFGGQVGLSGHIETADDVTIYAQSGVAKSIPESGVYFGTPIKERLKAFKIEAVINHLPELFKDMNEIKKKLENK